MAYTSQANIEAFLNRDLTTNEETLLTMVQTVVDGWIDDQLEKVGWSSSGEETRYYDGGTAILDIDPCRSVSAIESVDPDESSNTTYDTDEDLEICPRNETLKKYIEKRYNKFPSGLRNIAVTAIFNRGATAPDDIVWLSTYLCGYLFRDEIKNNLKSESIEGYSRTFGVSLDEVKQKDPLVKTVLDKYNQDDVYI